MVDAFGFTLKHELARLGLSSDVLREIQSRVINLAGLELPPNLDASTSAAVRVAVTQAFVFGFRLIMVICVSLAVAGGAVTWLFIPRSHVVPEFGSILTE